MFEKNTEEFLYLKEYHKSSNVSKYKIRIPVFERI